MWCCPLSPPSFMRHLISMLTPDSTSEWHQNKWAGKAIFLNSWPFANFSPWTKTLQEEGQAAIKSNQKEIKGQGLTASLEQSTSLQAKWPWTSGAGMLEGISADTGLVTWARTTNAITFLLQQQQQIPQHSNFKPAQDFGTSYCSVFIWL